MKRIIVLSIAALALAGCSAKAATTATTAKAGAAVTTTTKVSNGVGSTLKASSTTGSYDVTLVNFVPDANAAFATDVGAPPSPGQQYIGFCLSVKNTASATAKNDAMGFTTAVGSDGKNYPQGWIGSVNLPNCPGLGNSGFTLTSGQTVTGGFAIRVPAGVSLTSLSFSPSMGVGGTTATWKLQ